jgi:hypothetical protein
MARNRAGAVHMVRQGDVMLELVAKLPAGLVKQPADNGRVILARGEVTGHHHSLAADASEAWKGQTETEFYVEVDELSELVHQEHSAIAVEPGIYRVRKQREYSPQEIRSVRD